MNPTHAEIESFTHVLHNKYGLDFTCYECKSLQRRINRVLHRFKCESIHNLWTMMLRDKQLIYEFMDQISVGLTSMFRDPQMWGCLKKLLMKYGHSNEINIWSAGCSTGEEIFTLAIVLKEMGYLDKSRILATDMNNSAMQTAKGGIYHKVKMVNYERNYKQFNQYGNFSKYYTIDGQQATMDAGLIKGVRFKYHNLITDGFHGKYDLIFIRNVMIYFDQRSKERLIDRFYDHLNPNGYLILGYYDSLLPQEQKSRFNSELANFRVFKKEKGPHQLA